jgi:hypothetical protein
MLMKPTGGKAREEAKIQVEKEKKGQLVCRYQMTVCIERYGSRHR